MAFLKRLTHTQIRYLLIPPLALLLVHFVMYKKYPFEADYQFPMIPFITAMVIVIVCCEANTQSYNALSKRLSLLKQPAVTIFKQVCASLLLTTFVFAAVVYSINYFIFGIISPLNRFLSSLFIALSLVSIETLIYIIRDFRKAHKASELLIHSARQDWLINTGKRMINLNPQDVAYLYSQSGLVYIVTKSGEKHLTQFSSLNALTEQLHTASFFRLNRQYLISASAVKEIQKEVNQKLRVLLTPTVSQLPEEAMVSRYTGPDFKKWLKQ